jgi:TonB-linked SusC/RagA family outer membrane protein
MKLAKILAIVAAFVCCNISMAQTNGVVKGKVVNEGNDKPMKSASVTLVGAKKATATDENGNFTIKLPDEKKQYKLSVVYQCYTTKEVSVKAGDNITILLKEDVKDEGEVVIQTGYGGGIKKKELAASVSTVGAKDLKDIPINSVAEALNGRLAGVTATTAEGSPDADVKVRVRGGGSITGDNSPLYVIDGVMVESGLSNVVLQDIQDITVLKDAAATAIYGARGANGVIVITTKSGKSGKLRVTYNTFYGIKTLAKTLDVLSPNDFVLYQYERSRASGTDMANFASKYVSTWDSVVNFAKYKNIQPINWQDEAVGKKGYTMQQNIGFSGGNKLVNYNFGYTYQDDKAIVLNSLFKKHQLNLKTEFKVTSKLKLGLAARYSNQNVYGAGTSDASGASYNRLRQSIKFTPYLSDGETIDDTDPIDPSDPGNGLFLINPVKLANQEYKRKITNTFNITASLTYNINKHLTFKSTFGIDNSDLETRSFFDSLSSVSRRDNSKKPIVSFDSLTKKSWINSNTITYSLKNYKRKHDLEVLLGQEMRELKTQVMGHQYYNISNGSNRDSLFKVHQTLQPETVGYLPSTASGDYLPGRYTETAMSFFTRIGYTYNKKYIFNFVLRADGSSKFIDENKWGFFPSGSFAWRVSNEKFFEKVKFFSDVKFRVGYGSNGNSRIGDYKYASLLANTPYVYGLNGNPITAWTPTGLANQQIKWESMVNRNIGLDVTFLNKKLELSIDYYHNTSKDLLLAAQVAQTFGYTSQIQNIGKTKNSGFEFQLNANVLQNKNGLNWTANLNLSFNNSEIVELNNGLQSYFTEPAFRAIANQNPDYIVQVGQPIGTMWGFVTDGFYKIDDFDYNTATQVYTLKPNVVNNLALGESIQPGSIKFKDLDGNGTVTNTDADKKIIGNANAKFTGGLNQQFNYKNFDLSLFLNFSYGNDIFNANKLDFTSAYTANANMLATMGNRWKTVNEQGMVITDIDEMTRINKNASIWRPLRGASSYFPHSWAIEDGSFIRINNLTIGYSLPIKTLAKLRISRFRIYVTGNNLAVFSKYTGYDPEVSVRKSQLQSGLDYSAYPKSRSFIVGLNVNF